MTEGRPSRFPAWARRLGIAGIITLATLSLGEMEVRWTGLDLRMLRSGLKYNTMDLPSYRRSDDPFLRYELAPGTANRYEAYRVDGHFDHRTYGVTVGPFGEREPSHPLEKGPGVFRIALFGASSSYGSGVSDDETLPAALERRLNRMARDSGEPGLPTFEVLNFAAGAYQESQMARRACRVLDQRRPDLVLVQANVQERRAFLGSQEAIEAIDLPTLLDDPDSVQENFPAPWVPEAVHQVLLRASGLYRVWIGLVRSRCPSCDHVDRRGHAAGRRLNRREMERLAEEAGRRHVPVHVFGIPLPTTETRTGRGSLAPLLDQQKHAGLPGVTANQLVVSGADPVATRVHPPAWALEEWAADLADDLCLLKKVPLRAHPPIPPGTAPVPPGRDREGAAGTGRTPPGPGQGRFATTSRV